jgi:hypothetical protein
MELVNMKRVKTGHLRCVLSGAFKLLDCSVHYSSFISAPRGNVQSFHNILLQSSLNSLPINHIPNSIKVFCLAILILQVIRMLPSINTQQWGELAYNRILVCICADQDLTRFVVFDEPGPAAALDTGERGIEFALEGGEVFVAGLNRCLLFTPSISQMLIMI